MKHKLPNLLYAYDALEPHIDGRTMKIHHDLHHGGYVSNLNTILNGHPILNKLTIEELLATKIRNKKLIQPILNNGGGHVNHSLFWKIMAPPRARGPQGRRQNFPEGYLKSAIKKEFSSVEKFKELFADKALKLFGSGWVFLMIDKGKLKIKRHSFQNSPLMNGNYPVLGLDVWEHAYYLKYQNRRADYIKAWWNVVNWEEVESRFNGATVR